MKRLKKIGFVIIAFIICCSPLLSACDLLLPYYNNGFEKHSGGGGSYDDEEYIDDGFEIVSYPESDAIVWDTQSGYSGYNICVNGVATDYVSRGSGDVIVYEYDDILVTEGEYEIYVVANSRSRYSSNLISNKITINYKPSVQNIPLNNASNYKFASENIPFQIVGTVLSYTPINKAGIVNYELFIYSYSNGLEMFALQSQSSDLLELCNLKNEIYAIRIGYVLNGDKYIASEVKYLNPDNYLGYTDNIYLFDGKINDYYIEDLDELRDIVYYSFVNKVGSMNVKLSSEFESLVEDAYFANSMADRLRLAVANASEYFYETREGYSCTCKLLNANNRTYNIRIDYTITQCDITYTPEVEDCYIQSNTDTFYDLCGYTMRADDDKYESAAYDDFDSDKQFLYTNVSTSEQLYWAVENKVTPIVTHNSRAEQIYGIAKNVLNSIISDEMSDYEKALSIFDWISYNTSYDYASLEDGYYSDEYATIVPAYYLEGVFITGYAVCDGFSKAYSLLCNMEGIDAIRIVGTAATGLSAGGHAWNKVLIDKDVTDNIPAMYYIVDITWTEFVGGREEETLSHHYFLIDDNSVANTHYPFEKRTKFNLYVAGQGYDYYNNTIFTYNDSDYDLIIDSEEDITAMFYYMLDSKLKSFEMVVDYDFLLDLWGGNRYSLWMSLNDIINSLFATFKTCKFDEQYLFMNYTGDVEVYDSSGHKGIVFVLLQNFRIDADGEVEHLVTYFDEHDLYGTYNIYIEDTMLAMGNGQTPYEKIVDMFDDVLDLSNINIAFEYVDYNSEETESHFVMIVSER